MQIDKHLSALIETYVDLAAPPIQYEVSMDEFVQSLVDVYRFTIDIRRVMRRFAGDKWKDQVLHYAILEPNPVALTAFLHLYYHALRWELELKTQFPVGQASISACQIMKQIPIDDSGISLPPELERHCNCHPMESPADVIRRILGITRALLRLYRTLRNVKKGDVQALRCALKPIALRVSQLLAEMLILRESLAYAWLSI